MLQQYRERCSQDWGEINRSSAVKYGVKWETGYGEEKPSSGVSDSKTGFKLSKRNAALGPEEDGDDRK